MSTLLNLSGKIDPQIITVFDIVGRVITELGIPYVCVGATARDLVLRHGYGAPLQRATQDIDFAIEVPDWAAFETLKKTLEGQGATTVYDPTCGSGSLLLKVGDEAGAVVTEPGDYEQGPLCEVWERNGHGDTWLRAVKSEATAQHSTRSSLYPENKSVPNGT